MQLAQELLHVAEATERLTGSNKLIVSVAEHTQTTETHGSDTVNAEELEESATE